MGNGGLESNDTVITRYTGIRRSFKENQTARLRPFASIRAELRFLIISMKFDLRIDIYYSFFSVQGEVARNFGEGIEWEREVSGIGAWDCGSLLNDRIF